MTCHCATPQEHSSRAESAAYESARYTEEALKKKVKDLEGLLISSSVDSSRYQIEQLERIGKHLVLKVKYPSCKDCAYEGNKVLVFLNVSEKEAMLWRRIDPHFRPPKTIPHEAPCPAARFPATPEGWTDALVYVRGKEPFDKVTR